MLQILSILEGKQETGVWGEKKKSIIKLPREKKQVNLCEKKCMVG